MSFEEYLDDAVKFGDTQRTCFTKGYEAGQQSRQAEIDELKERIDDCIKAMDDSICDIDCGTIYGILEGDTK